MVGELRIANLPPGHGRYIYAYCNIRTNQVLYSLERTLRNSHLKQLADVGANNNPPKLRKDIWRPLFTVSLPDTHDGRQQGQQLFRHLREYRLLHETNWDPPEEMKRPYTEKEIEAMQKKLDDRGGSKKETVYDIIKREKWKMRVKMVMNQKANSIADLAAILLRQAEKGAATAEERAVQEPLRRQRDIELMIDLAEQHERGGLAKLADTVKELHDQVREDQEKSKNKDYKYKERKGFFQQSLRTQRKIDDTQLLMQKMEWSAKVVRNARYWVKTQSETHQLAAKIKNLEIQIAEAEKKSDDSELSSDEREAAYQDVLRMKRIVDNTNYFIDKTNWVGLVPSDAESRAHFVASLTPAILDGWKELAVEANDIISSGKKELNELRSTHGERKTAKEKAQIQSQMSAIRRRIEKVKLAKNLAAKYDGNWTTVAIEARLVGQSAGDSELPESTADSDVAAADVAHILSQQSNALAGEEAGAGENPQLADFREYLPEFPPNLDFVQAAKQGYLPPLNRSKEEKKVLKPLLKLAAPIFTADGVTVKWSNILDAEYAEFWPEGVKHEPLGFARYTAPKPDARPREQASYLEDYSGDADETTEPVAYSNSVVEAGPAMEDRQSVIDQIRKQLVSRANTKARARPRRYSILDKKWAARDAAKLRESQQIQDSSEPPAQKSAPSL